MEEFMLCSLPTLISIPTGAVDLYGEVFTIMTDNIFSSLENQTEPGPSLSADRAFKIYFGFPQIFFRNITSGRLSIKEAVRKRLHLFLNNDLDTLIADWIKDKKKWEMKIDKNRKVSNTRHTDQKVESQIRLKKALEFIHKGFMSKGLKILEGNGVAPKDNQEVIRQMIQKHPQEFKELPLIDADIDYNTFDMENIVTFIKTPELYKGDGPRSLRPDYLGKLATGKFTSPTSQRSLENLKKLGRYYLGGFIPTKYRSMMSSGLLTPLKKNAIDIDSRPANAEDFDTRVFCQTIAKDSTETVKEITTPQQLAVGVSGGNQLYTCGTYLKIEEAIVKGTLDLSVLSMDIWNAHNDFDRQVLDESTITAISDLEGFESMQNDMKLLSDLL
jgi:hypothetical protein